MQSSLRGGWLCASARVCDGYLLYREYATQWLNDRPRKHRTAGGAVFKGGGRQNPTSATADRKES